MINRSEILQTIAMIDQQHLDIRTITMGISLLDCADTDIDRSCTKVYDKICRLAGNLVRTGEDIEAEFGIPIVNKRVSVTPISLVAAGTGAQSYVPYAKALDRAAHEIGVNFLGGFSALVHKGMTDSDRVLIASIPEALADEAGVRERERRLHARGHQHGCRGRDGPHRQARCRAHGRAGRHGLRQARSLCQRRGGQSLHGWGVPRRG